MQFLFATLPVIYEQRTLLTDQGWVGYHLKSPCRAGTTRVIFESLDFIATNSTCSQAPGKLDNPYPDLFFNRIYLSYVVAN
jgi:hypothetical protein